MKQCPQCARTYPEHFTLCPQDGATLRLATELTVGTLVKGKYKILRKVGEGGMGVVFKARHVRFDEVCAMKLISPAIAHDVSAMKRFEAEAVMMRKLDHKNVLKVLDLDETEDGRPFLVMEFVEGEDLSSILKHGPLSVARTVDITVQVCDALAAAHKLSIVHRDIKPTNILVSRHAQGSDHVKVFDFGIAKVKEGFGLGGPSLTQTGILVGTPDYMSPEQAQGLRGDELDGRSDLYSLAVVVFEMLTGRVPFVTNTPVATLMAHVGQPPPDPRTIRSSIPAPVVDVLLRALEKEPRRRFQSALQMRESFHAALAAASEPATLVTRRPPIHWAPPADESHVPAAPPRIALEDSAFPETRELPKPARRRSAEDDEAVTNAGAELPVFTAPAKRGFRWVTVALLAGVVTLGVALAVWKPWEGALQPQLSAPGAASPPRSTATPPATKRNDNRVATETPAKSLDGAAPPLEKSARKSSEPPAAARSRAESPSNHSTPAPVATERAPRFTPQETARPDPAASRAGSGATGTSEAPQVSGAIPGSSPAQILPAGKSPGPPRPAAPAPQRIVYQAGTGGVSYARCLECPAPSLPPQAYQEKVGGAVLLRVLIGANGRPREISVARAAGFGMDEEAMRTVARWRFQPSRDGSGQPVDAWNVVEVKFRFVGS